MKLLLDTHVLLWFEAGDARLSKNAKAALESKGSELFISVASVWELAIKIAKKRLKLDEPIDIYMRQRHEEGFRSLDINWKHAAMVAELPMHHRDPFDRMLAMQALAEDMTLVSADPAFKEYDLKLLW